MSLWFIPRYVAGLDLASSLTSSKSSLQELLQVQSLQLKRLDLDIDQAEPEGNVALEPLNERVVIVSLSSDACSRVGTPSAIVRVVGAGRWILVLETVIWEWRYLS